jgi:hypothetical protein
MDIDDDASNTSSQQPGANTSSQQPGGNTSSQQSGANTSSQQPEIAMVSYSTTYNTSLWVLMTIIALTLYKMRSNTNTGFNGWGVLLCILCCPQLYIIYTLVDLFIN